jgi:creatinine amidohydrolase
MDDDDREDFMTHRLLAEMTSRQVADYLAGGKDAVLLPVGSCEQHGPHCPLGTDTFITQELALRISHLLDVIVAPMVPVGLSDPHLAWPGSLSLRVGTISRIIQDYAESLITHGFRTHILFFFHTKNKIPLDAAAWELKRRHGSEIKLLVVNAFAAWQSCAGEILRGAADPLWLSHGGAGETACMQRLGLPIDETAMPERFVPGDFLEKSRSPEVYEIIHDLARYAPNGVWGDPRKASPELGERIFATVSKRLSELISKRLEPHQG